MVAVTVVATPPDVYIEVYFEVRKLVRDEDCNVDAAAGACSVEVSEGTDVAVWGAAVVDRLS